MEKESQIEYENRITAFIDILGFKEIIKDSNKDLEKVQLLYEVLNFLKSFEKPDKWSTDIIEIEESAQYKGIDSFKVDDSVRCTTFSDSIVVSIKVNDEFINEIASTLISNLCYVGSILIQSNILWRGGLTYGNLIHKENGIVMGQALIDAYLFESKYAKFPRIILSDKLIKALKYPYKSKAERYPFHQFVERYEDGLVGFHQLKYFEVVKDYLPDDTEALKRSIERARITIINGLDNSFDSSDVFAKYKWLKEKYNGLYLDKKVKPLIRELNEGIAGNNVHYSYTKDFYDSNNKETN